MKKLLLAVAFGFMGSGAFAADVEPLNLDTDADVSLLSSELDYGNQYDRDHRRRRGRVKCIARNGRGARYVGFARIGERHRARRRAMRECRWDSYRPRSCYIVRCKRVGRSGGGRHGGGIGGHRH